MDHSEARHRAWNRILAVAGAGVLLLVAGIAFVAATDSGFAEPGPQPVPDAYREPILAAAASCPSLTPARLAGQIMAESAFAPDATNDRGGGLAGLTEAEFAQWRPSEEDTRDDPIASIDALAHLMCDTVGHLRVANVIGDPWVLAVAAFRTDLPSVIAADGPPEAVRGYVATVVGYAASYAELVDLRGTPVVSPSATPRPASTATSPGPTTVSATTPDVRSPGPTTAGLSPSRSAPTTTQPAPQPTTTTPPPPPVPLTAGALLNPEFGCLSATAALDGTHLSVAGCDGSLVQHWESTPDGRIHSVGLCMDAANAGTADWTPVQVAYCSANPAQLFTLDSSGHLYSAYAGKCVNVHWTPEAGTSVVLFGCLNQPNQMFSFVAR